MNTKLLAEKENFKNNLYQIVYRINRKEGK